MIQKKLKVGIAGYGIVGKRRRQFIDSHPHLQTVAVCDQTFGQQTNINGVKSFTRYQELLNEPLDILFVSLPNYMAPEVTIAGLERKLHVLCEKPPGRDVADIEAVFKVKKKYPSLCLKYGFNHRYHDSVRDALQLVKSQDLGRIHQIRGFYGKSGILTSTGHWRSQRKFSGGGILLDQGIHMVDLMRLFYDEFTEVKSFISNLYWNWDVEDNAYAIMRDKQGRIALLHSSATQWQHKFSLEITLAEGYIELSGILTGSKSYGEERLIIGHRTNSPNGTNREETITYLEDNSWRDEINDFADSIIHNKPIVSGTVEDALATMKLVYKIYWADPEWRKSFNIQNPI